MFGFTKRDTQCGPITIRLIQAKARIDTRDKWCKGMERHWDGKSYCSIGAIAGPNNNKDDKYHKAKGYLSRAMPFNMQIEYFNDFPLTTHGMVMRRFNKAIRKAKRDGV